MVEKGFFREKAQVVVEGKKVEYDSDVCDNKQKDLVDLFIEDKYKLSLWKPNV